MSKIVVLAEKPSVGRDIANVLKCTKKGSGYFEGSTYIVTWALGHLVTLADPATYDKKYETWRIEDLPMLPDELRLVVMRQTSKQFNTVKGLLHRKDVSSIVIATDAGREGELVARWIIDQARVRKPIKRLWISSVTDQAIRDGFKRLKPGRDYENLYASAVARAEADWYVGLNATRALTTKFNAQLSAGRVQTPTLAMIAAREDMIRTFKPRTFYGIEAKTSGSDGWTFVWQDRKKNERMFDQARAEKMLGALNGKSIVVENVEKRVKRQHAPQLYDLTTLQQDANRIYNFSGKKTLSVMQLLYERHKVLTYPRTDSRVITTDIVPTLKERLEACGVDQYAKHARSLARQTWKLPKSVVNNAQVSDHHAIIPTEQPLLLDELSADERKVYDLVVMRFFAVLSDPHEFEQISVRASAGDETFVASAKVIQKNGWKSLVERDSGENATEMTDTDAARIREGDRFSRVAFTMTRGETKPPSRFTEGTLLQAMENPVRYLADDDQHLAKTIQQSGGLGTVATRADIIDKLFSSMSMEMKGKHIFLTAKGRQLLELVPEGLRSPALTAEWEQKLSLIAQGTLKKDAFIVEMKQYAKDVVREIKQSDVTYKHDNLTGTKCPNCERLMLEIDNRHGKMLVCQDRSCGYKRNIFKRTNARCPNCRKRLELHGQGDGQTFRCKCGHTEKLSSFNKRRQKEKKHNVSKKEVNKYLKKQDDGFKNNALADALAKFKKE